MREQLPGQLLCLSWSGSTGSSGILGLAWEKLWLPKHMHEMGCFPPPFQSSSQTNLGQKGPSGGVSPNLLVKAGLLSRLDQVAADLVQSRSEDLRSGHVTDSLGPRSSAAPLL